MRGYIDKPYLDGLRQKLIDAEERGDPPDRVDWARTEYRTAGAAAYSSGLLVFADPERRHP